MRRSTAGSSARFRKMTARRRAPVLSKSSMNTRASSCVMPMAANTPPNGSCLPRTFACRAIWRPTSNSSPYPSHSVFSTKMSGPAISVIVRYSVGISGRSQPLEFLVHLGERVRELLVELRLVLHACEQFAGFQRRNVFRRDVEFHRLLSEVGILLDRAD